MQKVTVVFKGDVREITMNFSLMEDGTLDYGVNVKPELTPEDDAVELETKLSYIFLKALEGAENNE